MADQKIAFVRIKGGEPQVKFPEDEDFGPLTGWFDHKSVEKIIAKLKELPANKGLVFKIEGK